VCTEKKDKQIKLLEDRLALSTKMELYFLDLSMRHDKLIRYKSAEYAFLESAEDKPLYTDPQDAADYIRRHTQQCAQILASLDPTLSMNEKKQLIQEKMLKEAYFISGNKARVVDEYLLNDAVNGCEKVILAHIARGGAIEPSRLHKD
jgi:hypothetical protein